MAATSSMPAYLLPGVPVHQPSHLEGDASLATEILPGPPSLLSVVQHSTQKRDLKKPVYSYLHPTDPGSTYSGIVHGTIIGQEEGVRNLKGKRRCVPRPSASSQRACCFFPFVLAHRELRVYSVNSAVTGRAQRASARNHNGAASAPETSQGEVPAEVGGSSLSQPISVPSEPYIMVPDDETSPSRSNSAPNTQEGSAAAPEPKRGKPGRPKGKGKAKETELPVRIKEEPKAVSLALQTPEPLVSNQIINNEDHCSSCRSHGALVYCDGCPRAFHLWCLNPPMERIDEDRWFCPACVIKKHPPRKPPPGLFSPLIQLVQTSIPTEYQLPEEVRTFFKDVGTGPKGTYVDNSVVRQPRQNRFGLIEDRDAHRLRDKNGEPVLCFKCGTSALPPGLAATVPAAKRARRSSTRAAAASAEIPKNIVSCDYCNLHWHLDCLDPPLPTMPPINKKWMCPNHAEKVLLPKLRIPKQAAPIEITKPRQFNNGIIEIIHPQTASTSKTKKVAVDEVLINGRRYRVPERIVVLDFWNKVSMKANVDKDAEGEAATSGMSSPLTSLSSLDDSDERIPGPSGSRSTHDASYDDEDLRAAQMLCNFQLSIRDHSSHASRSLADRAVQTDLNPPFPSATSTGRPARASTLKRVAHKTAVTNGHSRTPMNPAEDGPSTSTAKRKRNVNGVNTGQPQPTPSTRELRPRSSRQVESMISVSSKDSSGLDDPFISSSSKPAVRVKMEEHENGMGIFGGSPVASSSKTTSRGRPIRRPSQKGPPATEEPPKRGRKRKEREEDVESEDEDEDRREAVEQLKKSRTEKETREKVSKGKEKEKPKEKEKKNPSPTRPAKALPAPSTSSASTSGAPPPAPAPTTPSLKIRLPRLSDIAMHTSPSAKPKSLADKDNGGRG
ncbi:Histone deacetylase associated PHD protein-2 [Mycena venus]|uniref:Histone deacetylase associated PHD protein-2 n=1 Tax=Mycena venus TaxID=2733690 RepID=A0A8H7CKD6_9AGAR|nr:Histone deacetylase associated PHD protein-2 [Mycena venus]